MKKYLPILFLSFLFGCSSSEEENKNKSQRGYLPQNNSHFSRTVSIDIPEFILDSNLSGLKIDTASGKFSWKVANDKKERTYIIEEYRWNKYYKLGEVKGGKNNYSFHVPIDSGIYHLVVKYKESILFHGNGIDVPISNDVYNLLKCGGDYMYFSKPTRYEIYDRYGKIMIKGFGDKAKRGDLVPDVYYLNYGNKTTEFIVKR